MSKATAQFSFNARLDEVEGAFISTVIYIPPAVMKNLPQSRVRVKGTMNTAPFALAVQYRKSGKSFFIVSKSLRKAAGIKTGDIVSVKFKIVSDKVDVPAEMEAVLSQDDDGRKMWNEITPGLQRSLCLYINSVKNVDSRITRALFLINKVKQGAYTNRGKQKQNSKGK
jgi:hypothetical protein